MAEDQCHPFFRESCFQEGAMMEEEFGQALFYTTLELETAIATAKVEIARRDSDLLQLEEHLSRAIMERDEALSRSRRLQHENLMLRQQLDQNRARKLGSPKSWCEGEEAAVKECARARSPSTERAVDLDGLVADRPLPDKGKLLQAVMEAGPILQTLMLAGPLPQWQHPPPQLDSAQIPPVDIPNKRGVVESNHHSNESVSSESPKNKRIMLIS
ncbi:hypothetical protein MLD38_038074 [Melastoma candidum]|uniref:Uncharacterized protein n=1 Tax=Melastoma candidum TaxID=119954 RepID=A0ACB9KYD7_9MYRT|nr:hypothetical protein MLD38_038074 [Melastoma candidum]